MRRAFLLLLLIVRAFVPCGTNMPSADFCRTIRRDYSILSPGSGTCNSPPAIRLTAFNAQPPDLQPAPLMDMDFAARRQLVRRRMPYIRFLVHRLAPLLHASFRPRLATTPLRFAITSPPSGCEGDLHPPSCQSCTPYNIRPELSPRPYVLQNQLSVH